MQGLERRYRIKTAAPEFILERYNTLYLASSSCLVDRVHDDV